MTTSRFIRAVASHPPFTTPTLRTPLSPSHLLLLLVLLLTPSLLSAPAAPAAPAAASAAPLPIRLHITEDPKCFDEEVREGTLVAGSYKVVDGSHTEPFKVNAQVTNPSGHQLYWQHQVSEGHFGFTAEDTGEYSLCVWLPHEQRNPRDGKHQLEVTWTMGQAHKEFSGAAKKERLDSFDMELRNLQDMIEKVSAEMDFFHERELDMRMMTEKTHAYVTGLSIASLLICAGLAALQLWHLKRFFERKKLL